MATDPAVVVRHPGDASIAMPCRPGHCVRGLQIKRLIRKGRKENRKDASAKPDGNVFFRLNLLCALPLFFASFAYPSFALGLQSLKPDAAAAPQHPVQPYFCTPSVCSMKA
jgi:hypothetical protein